GLDPAERRDQSRWFEVVEALGKLATPQGTEYLLEVLAGLVETCVQHGLRQVIISPGSRSAPLTVSFVRHPKVQCRVVLDERAAAFIALGLAQQSRLPVGLICTSGTAGLNYGPAVAEAYFQEIPLVVFTADRPPEWINQQDGQTIHQQNLYGSHSRGSFQLPVDYSHPDARWQANRLVSEALNKARWPTPGPVQINVPLREPLYLPPDTQVQPSPPKIIRQTLAEPHLTAENRQRLNTIWHQAERKLIIAGSHPPSPELSQALNSLQSDQSAVLVADVTASLHQGPAQVHHSDLIFGTKTPEVIERLKPVLIVSFGGPVVSKYLKLFLRRHRPAQHWHLRADGQPIDTYQALTEVITVHPATFFQSLADERPIDQTASNSYRSTWLSLEREANQRLTAFLSEAPFGEFSAVEQVMRALPPDSNLQLGNSMPVRYANYLGLGPEVARQGITVNANRGTSGIDGTVSTTVGAALATGKITTLISGDLAFFYDRNALWHQHIPPNLRIVILNNQGGGIFKLIDGPGNLPPAELDTYFFTPQPLT
ncbi:MAG: 2-succinyl-5-enolpyruvyl-6-hydroxy-3-cyclohexene-1-carboxylic-acid synthase, partial [Anaerolineae bacterium]|nr:2-succinyl-5-enolpyruvyl-6-hydroxy-3-cyclohexene-1-carboxylic-acid synthase [Anaerolineae bacterium]